MKSLTCLFFSLFLSACATPLPENQEREQAHLEELIKDNHLFSSALYQQLQGDSNLLFSPLSVFSCLSMIYLGAQEQTAEQIEKALQLTVPQNKVGKAFLSLRHTLPLGSSNSSYQLHLANGLWVDQDTPIHPNFLQTVEEDFDGIVEDLNFHQTEQAMEIINEWASGQTQGKIKHLLQEGDVTSSTRMVLTNAIYFKGAWAKPFNPKETQQAPFWTTPTESVEMKMLHQTALFPYMENEYGQILALPFAGDHAMACLFFLPRQGQDIAEVQSSQIEEWLQGLNQEEVDVTLPSFTLQQRFNLNQALHKLGMILPFTEQADFSGIDGMRDLFLSQVVHEAFFALDEAGVTAAAATAGSINTTAILAPRNPIIFNANHPFLFLLVDLNTKAIIFMGKLLK